MSLETMTTARPGRSRWSIRATFRMPLSACEPGTTSGSGSEQSRVWKYRRPAAASPVAPGRGNPCSIGAWSAARMIPSSIRLTSRTLRAISETPFLAASISSSTAIGRYTSCAPNRNRAVGSCMSTLVSSTNRRASPARPLRPGRARRAPTPGAEALSSVVGSVPTLSAPPRLRRNDRPRVAGSGTDPAFRTPGRCRKTSINVA